MKNIFIIITLFFTMTSWSAEYYKAKIMLKDGKTLEGYATLPRNTVMNNAVRYKTSKNAKRTKIKNKKIAKAYYYVDGNEYMFERTKMILSFKSTENNHKDSYPLVGGEYWTFAVTRNPVMNTYYMSHVFFVNDKGEMHAKVTNSLTMIDSIYILFKRPNETYPFIITSYFGDSNRQFRKIAKKYFADDPALVKRIENREFKHVDFEKLAEAYIQNQ